VLARDCRDLIAQYRRDLEAQLRRLDLKHQIERLRKTYPVFKRYASAEELAALVGPGNENKADRDAVLRGLLVEIRGQPTLFPLLNWLFLPSLSHIFWRKARACPDSDGLLSEIRAGFYEVAATYPLHRPGSIGGNLYWDTWKRVRRWQREEARYREQYGPLGPAYELGVVPADVQDRAVFPERMEEDLLELVYRQILTRVQYELLLETKVYGRMTQKEWAKSRGVNYETARSWCHRAERAIREYAKAEQERREQDVPD